MFYLIIASLSFAYSQNGDAMEYYLKGEYAKLAKDFNLAISYFQKANSLDSNSAVIYAELADCYFKNDNHSLANIHYLKSLEKSIYSIDIGEKVLDFYDSIKDSILSRQVLDSLIYYNPNELDLRYKKASYAYLDKRYDTLLNEYKTIFYIDPENDEILIKMTEIGFALKKHYLIEELFTQIKNDFPKLTQPLLALSGVKIKNEKFIDGIFLIEKAYKISKDESLINHLIQISKKLSYNELVEKYLFTYNMNHPESISLKYLKINLAIEDAQFYYALKMLNELIISGEVNLSLLEELIYVSKKINKINDTFELIKELHIKESQNLIYPLLLAEIEMGLNNKNEALNWFLISLNIDKSNINLRHQIANLSESLFNYGLSDSIFNIIIEDDNSDASGLNNYAYSLCERPNPNLKYALSFAIKAIKLEPDNAAFLDTIGWIYFKLGDFKLALEYLLKSSQIDVESEIILNHLAEVYLKLNNQIEALKVYYRILNINPKNQNAIKKIKQLSYE